MLVSLIVSIFCASKAPSLPPHACADLGIERGTLQHLPEVEFGTTDSFMLTLDGKPRLVRLVPWSLRERGFGVGGDPLGLVDRRERLWRGTVEPGGLRISCTRLRDGWWGRVVGDNGQSWMLEPWGERTAVYNSSDAFACGGTCGVVDGVFSDSRGPVVARAGGPGGGGGLQVCGLAAEADWAFFQTWGADALGRVESVLDAMNLQYESEVGITHDLSYFLVRTSAADDPYASITNSSSLLSQFGSWWNTNQQLIERDVAHLFTGKELDGSVIGVAYLGVICTNNAYGLDQEFGNFNCRTDLIAHELGHNWSADHCDCGNPEYTMNPSITCANQFSPTQTVGDIAGFRSTRSCLESAPIRCCLLDGSCQATFRDACLNLGGFLDSTDASCPPEACTQTWACCFPDGACLEGDPASCYAAGASVGALNSTCAASTCDPVRALVNREVFVDLHPAGGRTEILRTELNQFSNVGKILAVTGTSERPLVLASATELRQNPEDLGRLGDFPGALSGSGDSWVVVGQPDAHETGFTSGFAGVDANTSVVSGFGFFEDQGGAIFDQDPSSSPVVGEATLAQISTDGRLIYRGALLIEQIGGGLREIPFAVESETGSCCYPDGQCSVEPEVFCNSSGGSWQGMNVQCSDSACPPPPPLSCQGDVDTNGAVNFEDILLVLNAWGPCGAPCPEDIDQDGMVGFSEILLVLAAFGDCPLPPPPLDRTGSCCLSDGSCAPSLSAVDCEISGGRFNGQGSICPTNLCQVDQGGCCLTDGTCQRSTAFSCLELGGSYRGDDVPCENYFCPTAPTANDDDVVMAPEGSVVLDVLANDVDVEGYGLSLATFDATSSLGGTVVQEGNALRYTAPSNTGVDSFAYQVQSIFGLIAEGTVVIELTDALPGVQVEYFDLDALSELPDFGPLVPISAEVLTQVNLPSTGGVFAGSGLSDDVGAVFEGQIVFPATGVWTLFTESDDGSRLLVDGVQIVDNDGLHGMQERSGTIQVDQIGPRGVRVEFFERGGGAGIIVRWEGPGTGKSVVPNNAWTYTP
ncbi:MAG: M12 family metallo-peptidase [Planctomycetota bacterium]|nr:M12 family metallo-peptidase [Planctomycetota bacterium]